MKTIKIRGGTTIIGASGVFKEVGSPDEKPAFKQKIESFELTETLITVTQWNEIIGLKERSELPVVGKTYAEIQEFIKKLKGRTGKAFRLPTEVEFEYASKGGALSKNYLYSGSNDIDEVGWYAGNTATLMPVKGKKPNELGIYDMSGNVWKVIEGSFERYSETGLITQPGEREYLTLRGGSYITSKSACYSISRFGTFLETAHNWMGFFLAL